MITRGLEPARRALECPSADGLDGAFTCRPTPARRPREKTASSGRGPRCLRYEQQPFHPARERRIPALSCASDRCGMEAWLDTGDLFPAFLCFHQHLRMHLHFLRSGSQEKGARSPNRRTSRRGLSTTDSAPRAPHSVVCFETHSGLERRFFAPHGPLVRLREPPNRDDSPHTLHLAVCHPLFSTTSPDAPSFLR